MRRDYCPLSHLMVTTEPSSMVTSLENPPRASARLRETDICSSPPTTANDECGITFTVKTKSPLFTSRRGAGSAEADEEGGPNEDRRTGAGEDPGEDSDAGSAGARAVAAGDGGDEAEE